MEKKFKEFIAAVHSHLKVDESYTEFTTGRVKGDDIFVDTTDGRSAYYNRKTGVLSFK